MGSAACVGGWVEGRGGGGAWGRGDNCVTQGAWPGRANRPRGRARDATQQPAGMSPRLGAHHEPVALGARVNDGDARELRALQALVLAAALGAEADEALGPHGEVLARLVAADGQLRRGAGVPHDRARVAAAARHHVVLLDEPRLAVRVHELLDELEPRRQRHGREGRHGGGPARGASPGRPRARSGEGCAGARSAQPARVARLATRGWWCTRAYVRAPQQAKKVPPALVSGARFRGEAVDERHAP